MTNMQLETDHMDIGELFGSKCIFAIPEYQRGYKWGRSQLKALWNDIQSAAEQERGHHLHEIKLVPESGTGPEKLNIIDGQQRITTISIMIAALRDEYQHRNLEDKYSEQLQELLETKDLDANRTRSLRLLNLGSDDDAYKSVYEGVEASQQIDGKVGDSYRYFKRKIGSLSQSELDTVRQFIIHRLTVVREIVEDLVQAFIMFESQNRGLELDPTDVVKSVIVRTAHSNNEDRDAAQRQWTRALDLAVEADSSKPTRAIKDAFLIRSEFNTPREVQGGFVSWMRDVFGEESNQSVTGLLDDLVGWLKSYKRVKAAQVKQFSDSRNEQINSLIRQFNLKNSHSGIILYWLHQNIDQPAELIEALDWGSRLSLRLFLADRTAHKKRTAMHQAFTSLQSGTDPKLAFQKQMNKSTPGDSALELELQNREFSRNRATRAVLYRVEIEHFGGLIGGSAYPTAGESYELEHIAPDRAFSAKKYSRWRSVLNNQEDRFDSEKKRLGNLTLLRSRRNQDAGARPFEQKAGHYRKADFSMSQQIAEKHDSWGFEQIQKRTANMANLVVRTFSSGSYTAEPIQRAQSDGGKLVHYTEGEK